MPLFECIVYNAIGGTMMKNTYDASSIAVLEGLEAVRKRPGMYIGSTGSKGVNHLLFEILDNSVDEHLAGYCDFIEVILHIDGSCTVTDNGRGIPVDLHSTGVSAERVILTTLHAGGKFDNKSYKTSGGLHGVGSSVVNALSQYLKIKVYRDHTIWYDEYHRGHPVVELTNGLLPHKDIVDKTGTSITFLPDSEIFGNAKFHVDEIQKRLHETAYLNPNLTIRLIVQSKTELGTSTDVFDYHEPEGLTGFIKDECNDYNILVDPITFHGESNNIVVDCVFTYIDEFKEIALGFCNNIYTEDGGTHITGFRTALTYLINKYARDIGVLKEKDNNFLGTDVRNGLVYIISVKHPDPRFEGQTKTKLDNSDVTKIVTRFVNSELTNYFDRHLDDLKLAIERIQRNVKLRNAENRAKTNLLQSTRSKYSFDANGKLANCISKDASRCELFIVEGDSAGGSAKTARNRNYQAILPIRGKILNVEKASIEKVLANAEIKSLVNALGCGFSEGYGNDFNIDNLRYDKIIIMTDADVDGAHIATLLLTLFYRFMPELVYDGHIYVAMPPLYKVIPSRGKEEYLYNDEALATYRKKHPTSKFILQRYKGLGEMDPPQLWETTLNPETRMLKQVTVSDVNKSSDTTDMLMGLDVTKRKQFIHDNANYAEVDA